MRTGLAGFAMFTTFVVSWLNMIDYSVATGDTNFFATGFAFKFLDIHVKNSTLKFSWD